jgi:hypothetical protein
MRCGVDHVDRSRAGPGRWVRSTMPVTKLVARLAEAAWNADSLT